MSEAGTEYTVATRPPVGMRNLYWELEDDLIWACHWTPEKQAFDLAIRYTKGTGIGARRKTTAPFTITLAQLLGEMGITLAECEQALAEWEDAP